MSARQLRVAHRLRRPRKAVFVAGLILVWAGTTACAFAYFWRIDSTPGSQTPAPQSIDSAGKSPCVLVFLHAQCPCSRATLSELGRLIAKLNRPTAFQIYFVATANDASWRESSLYAQATRLPNATITEDPTGTLAAQYGAQTSGQVIAYDAGGKLIFQGGITESRGHEGDSAGKSRLLAALQSPQDGTLTSPVYGCRLPTAFDPHSSQELP